jgi:dihydrolipoamide dehydrogenase
VEKVNRKDKRVKVSLETEDGKEEKEYDKVLLAVGRKPNSDKGNLDKAGISLDEKGFVKVDSERRSSNKNVFAIGDLTGEPLLAHKATHEGRIAAEVIAGEAGAGYDPRAIPAIVFTNPEIAWAGLTETNAEEHGVKFKKLKFPWSASGRAAAIGNTNGLTKLLVDPETGVILGGGVAGRNAGSLIPEILLAIEMGATAEDVSLSIHPHPTLSETIMEAAELFTGGATHFST